MSISHDTIEQGTWNTRAVRLKKLADLMTNIETG